MSAFFLFNIELQKKLRSENPRKTTPDIAKEPTRLWKEMTDKEKEPYFKLQKEDEVRQKNEKQQLEDFGYFVNSDGITSTEIVNKKTYRVLKSEYDVFPQ